MSGKIRTFVNGVEVTEEEASEYFKSRPSLDSILATTEGRRDLARAMSRDPAYYESHESISSGVPAGMAREHAEWVRNQGLVGVEVTPSGNVKFSGQRNKDEYLSKRGLADATSAGSGTKTPRRKAVKSIEL